MITLQQFQAALQATQALCSSGAPDALLWLSCYQLVLLAQQLADSDRLAAYDQLAQALAMCAGIVLAPAQASPARKS